MKKIIVCLLAVLVLFALCFVACSKDDKDAESTDPATTESVWDSFNEIIPGVAWSDLVEETEEPTTADATAETDDATGDAALESVLESYEDLFESGIELPIIPLP